ncbi:GyrI-like domain-containing protein [Aquimarina hainanensis]|uniref:GyrI-like domain-containing protein n=1 Tax=Aquimarina hainanensis TaxID=1578017 RepID=A0ABW5N8Q8_9FLAO
MKKVNMTSFYIIGVSVRTTNEEMKAATDIPELWNRFMTQQLQEVIPNKVDETLYAVYTNYEKDHTRPYDTVVGCAVTSLDNIPEGMVGITISAGEYMSFVSKGDLTQGAVYNTWLDIWNTPLERTYKTDFERYGEAAKNPTDAEVEIFVGVMK